MYTERTALGTNFGPRVSAHLWQTFLVLVPWVSLVWFIAVSLDYTVIPLSRTPAICMTTEAGRVVNGQFHPLTGQPAIVGDGYEKSDW